MCDSGGGWGGGTGVGSGGEASWNGCARQRERGMFSMDTIKRGTNERRKLRGARARVSMRLTTPLGESARPTRLVGVVSSEAGASGTGSSRSLLDIFRGSEECRTANSCGPGTGGGIKGDPGEGKGWQGSGSGSDGRDSQPARRRTFATRHGRLPSALLIFIFIVRRPSHPMLLLPK